MLIIRDGLPENEQEVIAYIESWRVLLGVKGGVKHDADNKGGAKDDADKHELQLRLFEHLYGNLDALDNKTNSLIQMAAILAAAYTFVLIPYSDVLSAHSVHYDRSAAWLFAMGVSYAAIAIYLCLRVIWVHWSSRSDLDNAEEHMKSLIGVRTQRTIRFRRAWTFSAISLAALIVLLLYENLGTRYSFEWVVPIVVAAHLILIYLFDVIVLLRRRPAALT